MATREEQKNKRRNEILNTALDLFVEKGYSATKTSDIAKQLHISDGLLFHYFATKELLYWELVKIGINNIKLLFDTSDLDSYSFFYNSIDYFFNKAKENRKVAKMFVLIDQAQNKTIVPKTVCETANQIDIIEKSVEIIIAGQGTGLFRSGDPLALSYTFWNAFSGIMQEIAINTLMPIPKAEWLMAILLKQREISNDKI